MTIPININSRFGRLTVIGHGETRYSCYVRYWECRCDCGTVKLISANRLRNGDCKSCGCLRREVSAERMKTTARTHGEAVHGQETVEFQTWSSRVSACTSPKNVSYKNYGGRGIKICEGYRLSYPLFLKDVGRRPSGSHSIDRINNNGHYSCGKCDQCLTNDWPFNLRWATPKQQARNRRDNHMLTINGETLCLSEWEERHGLPKRILSKRIRHGCPTENLFLPSKRCSVEA